MTLEKIAGMLIFLAIIIVPCIPVLWLMYSFLRDLIKILKEIVTGVEERIASGSAERAGFFAEYLQEQMEKYDRIQQEGIVGYYIDRAVHFCQEFSFLFYAIGMILFLTLLMFRRAISLVASLIGRFDIVLILSVLLTVLEILVLLYYVVCKTHRRKWTTAIVLVVILAVKQIWNLVHGSIEVSVDMVLFFMLFFAVYHYKQWTLELAKHNRILRQKLQEECYAGDKIVQQYLALEQHRLDIGVRDTIFRKLCNDDELDEMRMYLTWLKQTKEKPTEADSETE